MFHTMADLDRKQRSRYHLTLGSLIAALEPMGDAPVTVDTGGGVGGFDSYRGYYADLALEPTDSPTPARTVLENARAANGQTFTGYKGGEFFMGEDTPLWLASYGCCGRAVVGVELRGCQVTLQTKEVD